MYTGNMYFDTEFIILLKLRNLLKRNPNAKQREIARVCEVSLGGVSKILHSFEQRGWLSIIHITTRQTTYKLTKTGITAGDTFVQKLSDEL
jgi:predicted transcriptional regulator